MSKIIAVVNQKGGVGKTTTAINLSAALALEGLNCLLIDTDPQANATSGMGFGRDESRKCIYDVLLDEEDAANVLLGTAIEKLKLLPSSKHLIGANVELIPRADRSTRLRRALEPLRSTFDFMIMDCPPALDLLTLNALVAADSLLVPLQAEYFALEGVSELMHTHQRVVDSLNPSLAIEGVLLTMFDDRTILAQQVAEDLKGYFSSALFTTTIPRNIRLAEAPSHGQPIALYDPRSRGAESYRALAFEVLERNGKARPKSQSKEASVREVRLWPYA